MNKTRGARSLEEEEVSHRRDCDANLQQLGSPYNGVSPFKHDLMFMSSVFWLPEQTHPVTLKYIHENRKRDLLLIIARESEVAQYKTQVSTENKVSVRT